MLFLLGYLENCYLVGELAFGGDRGYKNLLGEESTGENFFRWGENEQTFGWCGGTRPNPHPHTYYSYLIYINSLQTLYTIVYIHCMDT